MNIIIFNDWNSIFRIIIVSIISYAYLVLILRLSGKRTLTKMNAFDLVVTIALGSAFSTAIFSEETMPLINLIVGLTMLVLLQYIVTWCSLKFKYFAKLVKSSPALIFYNGELLENIKEEHLLNKEVQAALRKKGLASFEEAQAVILETDGSISVITKKPDSKTHFSPENL